ncbi:type I-C CRISPR-associated protein Cas7/Csd2 [Parabacteroides sp. TM07-1AC]|uniref:type I-C CRISPR-associated protein Cas7/Csd2 n=1 Tax=Parabacteroides sp. TM07-1AC TaxID=2292363 RepID=UPI000EFEEBDB|nr:type I-C CRISPR-associated protein Cas7/Csd2 [Parabacteroides sp. TM07-1AC]RHU22907.1 type I-C CRISPR-associated protein Cas7/Csd2 [Parabacteroides sp. TM07-1AC]
METAIKNRYDFVYLFDVQDGNPNGDPDAGNLPRVDSETGEGLVSDVCLKRKVRNFIQIVKDCEKPYDIFIKEKAILNNQIAEAHKQEDVKAKEKGDKTEAARQWMCRNFYDIRTFGAVLSTGENAGQVRGPIQFTFARSIDPIVTAEHSITRMAVATEDEAKKQSGDNRTMGRKYTVPYGLYKANGFISAHLATQTGFNEDDLNLFWESLKNMFDHDHSAARGMMNARKLIVFKHSSALGNASAHTLFNLIDVKLKNEAVPPRSFNDYVVTIDKDKLPEGVELLDMI